MLAVIRWELILLVVGSFLVQSSSPSLFGNFFSLGSSKRLANVASLEPPVNRLKRRQSSGDGAEIDAEQLLDDEIEYLITTLPGAIDNAIDKTEAYQRVKIVKRMTWGYAILVASWLDMYSDFVGKNRTLGNLGGKDVVYRYGFLGISGVAFSFPLLLGLPDFKLECGNKDYQELLDQYDLSRGLDPLLEQGYTSAEVRSIVEEFDLWLRVKLQCVLDFEEEVSEAQELLFNTDELNAAMNLRLDLKDLEEVEAAQDGSGGDESSGNYRRQDFCLFGRRASKKTLSSKMQGFPRDYRKSRKDGTNIFRRGQGLSSRSRP